MDEGRGILHYLREIGWMFAEFRGCQYNHALEMRLISLLYRLLGIRNPL